MGRAADDWSDEEVIALKKMFDERLTSGQMERRLMGRSRCSICAKLARLGLRKGSNVVRSRKSHSRRSKPLREKAGAAIPVLTIPRDRVLRDRSAKRLTISEIEPTQCRWVHGDPVRDADWSFCGLPAVQPLPYCRGHCSVVYRDQPLATSEQAEPVSAPIPELQNA